MRQARGEVHARVRVAAQEGRDPVDVPFERGEVHADERQARMLVEHAVARGDLLFVARPFRVLGHVVLRMFREVFAVAADRHLVERQPGVARLALVAEHGHMPLLEPGKDGIESRIVDHDRAAIGIALLHADVLPHLDRDGALAQCHVEILLRMRKPAGAFAARGIECCRESNAVRVCALQGSRVVQLLRERRKILVHDVDREDAEAVVFRALREFRHLPYRCTCTSIFSNAAKSCSASAGRAGAGSKQGASEREDGREERVFSTKDVR